MLNVTLDDIDEGSFINIKPFILSIIIEITDIKMIIATDLGNSIKS